METTETSPHRMFAESSGSLPPDLRRDVDAYRLEFQDAIACVAPGLREVEARIHSELTSEDPNVSEMLAYVAGLGGKRLRPALTMLAARWLGQISEESVRLAVVVELVHTATLVHDDILDHATVRRHKPTVHCRWDVPSSVLIGDWLFTHAYRMANEGDSTLPGRWIADAAQRVCEGEIAQGNSVANWSLSEADYVGMLEKKTGALCGVSAALGAWSTGAPLEVCRELDTFGTQLGTAFQIFDDWLDVWGSGQNSGKTLGTDLTQCKPTLPVLRALNQWNAREREAWISDIGHGDQDALARMRAQLDRSDASAYTLSYARSLTERAVQRLDDLATTFGSRDNLAYQGLIRLARAAVQRRG